MRGPVSVVVCGLVFALLTSVGHGETGAPLAPSRADSGTQIIKHRGGVIGAKRSNVTLSVVIKGGKYVRVKNVSFGRVPVDCTGPRPITFVFGYLRSIRTHGSRFRYRGGLPSESFSESELLFFGRIQDNGAKAKGKLRWRFLDHTGDRCNTGLSRWKTHD